ncbi:MAG TPA: GlsB/YeaQ/YmgE family stress response membrane protein [Candidatus Limnocylindrales bacterium]|nr:GlsB/YeaQ/YmgE family stress response membrane protein [Candidatus Limnocylindrales bacterium]
MFFILALIVIPLAAGYIANLLVGKGKGFQPWELFVAGIIGSFVGGLLLNLITGDGLELTISGLIGSTIGAIIVLAIWGWLRLGPLKGRI